MSAFIYLAWRAILKRWPNVLGIGLLVSIDIGAAIWGPYS